ncbi:MAG: hypothetical protein QNJ77_01050 [Acidimicrobiia bacterium]|nr:hypothetical protein [Acidimicrobiia bacterium]
MGCLSKNLSRSTILFGLLLLLASVMAGCSDDSSDAGSSDTVAETSSTTLAETTTTTAAPVAAADDEEGHDHDEEGHDHEGEGHDHDDEGHDDDAMVEAGDLTRGRLVAASATLPEVYVVDLDDYDVSTIPVTAENAIIQGTGGMSPYVWMVHYFDDAVEVVDVGTYFARHGDHYHITTAEPGLHEFSMTGPSPAHLVTHDGLTAAWFDGSGEISLIEEAQLAGSGEIDVKTLSANMPHHGVAVLLGSNLIVTTAEMVDEAPNVNGAVAYCWIDCGDDCGTQTSCHVETEPFYETTDTCTALHGEASYVQAGGKESHIAYGCNEGILHIRNDTSGMTSEVVPYPEGALRPFFLKSHSESPVMVGAAGPGFVAFDVNASIVTSHSLPASQMTFAFEDSEHILVLAADGDLYRVSIDDFSVEGEPLSLVPAFGEGDTANVFVAANRLYALDSRDPGVVVVDLETWEVVDAGIMLPSAPNTFSFGAVGAVSPDW